MTKLETRRDVRPDVARGAAKWWRDVAQSTNINKSDNGDAMTGGFMSYARSMVKNPELPVEMFDKFEECLYNRIIKDGIRFLNVDYHPGWELEGAIRDAGMPEWVSGTIGLFPIKTAMRLYHAYAEAGLGYGAKFEVVAGVMPLELRTQLYGKWRAVTTSSTDGFVWSTEAGYYSGTKALYTTVAGEEAARAEHVRYTDLVIMAMAIVGPAVPQPSDDEFYKLGEAEYRKQHLACREYEDKVGIELEKLLQAAERAKQEADRAEDAA